MGKAVPRGVRVQAEELMEKFPEKFSVDFEKNKQAINELGFGFCKGTRNLIAGCIARISNSKNP